MARKRSSEVLPLSKSGQKKKDQGKMLNRELDQKRERAKRRKK